MAAAGQPLPLVLAGFLRHMERGAQLSRLGPGQCDISRHDVCAGFVGRGAGRHSINSAIERTVDYISEDIHPLAKAAKDAGSAAVAVTALGGGMAWLAILFG